MKNIQNFIAGTLIMLLVIFLFGQIYNRKKTVKEKAGRLIVKKPAPTTTSVVDKAMASAIYFVSPEGNDIHDGKSTGTAFKTMQKAIDMAMPGDAIELMPGTYYQDVVTKRSGQQDLPITIYGSKEAVVKGRGRARIFEINHSFITLDGFTVDGHFRPSDDKKSYRDKLIYVTGKTAGKGVSNLKVLNMDIINAGGECLRLRYLTKDSEIAYNLISNCGRYDFEFKGGGKNGEGIYIGTAPEQLKKDEEIIKKDISSNNWIHHNDINTDANECVDIKEGSSFNIIEYNDCTGQKDKESGGMDSRGNNNIFRYNKIYGNEGTGVRLGGDERKDGIENDVYGNGITANRSGGIKIQRIPQGDVCGNSMEGNKKGDAVGTYGEEFNPTRGC